MRKLPATLLSSVLISACVADGGGASEDSSQLARATRSGGDGPVSAAPDASPTPDCDADGHCNRACAFDPDCTNTKCNRGGAGTTRTVATPCGGLVVVRDGASDPLAQARAHIENKWPTFAVAQQLDYDDDNDGVNESGESCWRQGHALANLDGFGASLTHAEPVLGGCISPVWNDHHASRDPEEPSLLFFERTNAGTDTWNVIGAGYHYDYDACHVPCLDSVPEASFLIHEAGWHRVPGDGGFDCVRQQWVDVEGGVPVVDVDDQCANIENPDFHRLNVVFGLNKHGRAWTLHVFFEPGTNGVALAMTDPWCRERDDPDDPPVVGVDCPETAAFYPLTATCACE